MTVRVFVGCDANGTDAESLAVLEYSIRKQASEPVELVFMRLSRDPENFYFSDAEKGWQTQRWATVFSGFRWSLASYCGFEGRAIYVDSDFIVMSDIAELWRQPMHGKVVLGKSGSRLCMSLWDCAAAKPFLWPIERLRSDPGAHHAMSLRFRQPDVAGLFEGHWNVLDGEDFADIRDPRIKAHHYTDIGSQVHLKHALPRLEAAGQTHWFDGKLREHKRPELQALFDEMLFDATLNGYPVSRYVPNELYGDIPKASLVNYRKRA